MSDYKSSILGTFEGECADSTITNLNGIDITREVWETVFASDEYKEAIKNGFYLGFLGHPEDPACQDFEHACIVMTEGKINSDGKVMGKFNLVDTPVGNTVKKFIDAGVTFGISVRGIGDVVGNSVDPESFVFRGFDLVTFPAYPNAIPVFKEIAASTDLNQRRKYVAACTTVKSNIDSYNEVEIDNLMNCFAPQSEEYKLLTNKKLEFDSECVECQDAEDLSDKLNAMTELYLSTRQELSDLQNDFSDLCDAYIALDELCSELESQNYQLNDIVCNKEREIDSINRITASQMNKLKSKLSKSESRIAVMSATNSHLRKNLTNATTVADDVNVEMSELQNKFDELSKSNLLYKQEVESAKQEVDSKTAIVSSLNDKLAKTVGDMKSVQEQASNLDDKCKSMQKKLTATEKLLSEFQIAYADLYANTVGVNLDCNIPITASVDTVRRDINSAISSYSAMTDTDNDENDYLSYYTSDEDGLITL